MASDLPKPASLQSAINKRNLERRKLKLEEKAIKQMIAKAQEQLTQLQGSTIFERGISYQFVIISVPSRLRISSSAPASARRTRGPRPPDPLPHRERTDEPRGGPGSNSSKR